MITKIEMNIGLIREAHKRITLRKLLMTTDMGKEFLQTYHGLCEQYGESEETFKKLFSSDIGMKFIDAYLKLIEQPGG